MKIAQIVNGLSRANGVTVFVENVVRELSAMGHEVQVVTPADASVDYRYFDVAHIHGLWHPWLHRQAVVARKYGIRVVWSPHGMLTPWAMRNRWWKKCPAWFLYQRRDLAKASAIHVTAQSEAKDVRRLGFKNELIVAPLGVRLSECRPRCEKANHKRTLLFVGRIHRIKGLDRLLHAYSRVMAENWKLLIVGPDQEGHTEELKQLSAKLGITDSVEFSGPRYGQELKNTYASADCFVLPSYTENFGSVVVESLAFGVPVIATKGTSWQELDECHCGWWVDILEDGLEGALREVFSMERVELAEMGMCGRKLVEAKYTWPAVTNLDFRRDPPNHVSFSRSDCSGSRFHAAGRRVRFAERWRGRLGGCCQ